MIIYLKIISSGHGISHVNRIEIRKILIISESYINSLFSTEIPVGQCPMLIGIMQTLNIEKCESLKSKYQFRLLLENNKLTRTKEKVTLERLLNELITFKEQFDENQQNLVKRLFYTNLSFTLL